MTKYLATFLLLTVSFFSYGLSLDGTWQEDTDKTIQWDKQYTKIDSSYLKKLSSVSGHMYLTYKNGKMCQFHEPYTVNYEGQSKEVSRLITETAKFSILSKNKYGYVLKIEYDKNNIATDMLIFENDDSFYGTRLTTEDYGYTGGRIYFKKVNPVKWGYDCGQ